MPKNPFKWPGHIRDKVADARDAAANRADRAEKRRQQAENRRGRREKRNEQRDERLAREQARRDAQNNPGGPSGRNGGRTADDAKRALADLDEEGRDQRPRQQPPAKPAQQPPPQPQRKPTPVPKYAAGPSGTSASGGRNSMSQRMTPRGDESLQKMGRQNLAEMSAAADEVAAAVRRAEELAEEARQARAQADEAMDVFRQGANQIASMGNSELPANPRLRAELESLAARAGGAETSDDWRGLAADADAVPQVYQQEHEVDEGRLNGERAPLSMETRADVSYASQDN